MNDGHGNVGDSHLDRRQARVMFAFAIVFPVIATLFLAARLYSNHLIGKKYGWDDWTTIGALVSGIVLSWSFR